jgi:hypothetical protein
MTLRWSIVAAASMLLALLLGSWVTQRHTTPNPDQLLLLLPDDVSLSDPKVTVWLDAAREEGIHIRPARDSEFVRPFFGSPECSGLILPDYIHPRASDYLIGAIRRFVSRGGKLMLVYDAGTLSPTGRYARGQSRLSDLAGIDYALYDRLQDNAIRWGNVGGSSEVLKQMNIPPGKYYPFAPGQTTDGAVAEPSPGGGFEAQLTRYLFGDLKYPSYLTSGSYAGKVLLHSGDTLVVGEHDYEKGSVLFVNLPLGYLKANTDGLPLHVLLKYFAEHFLALPYLMSVPDGIGGLVLNWHVDSNAAIKPMEAIDSWSLAKQGPYSIHVTAGPDDMRFGDGEGFNVANNPVSQQLLRKFLNRGDTIGSHGGWIHDYFAHHVDKDPPAEMEKYLAWNKSALEQVTGRPDIEYSAPDGNQPSWVTTWLEAHGFVAYYFTGDSGMGPTQGYRDGVREGQNIWTFPIVHLNRAAAFEEMVKQGYSPAEIQSWLQALTDFTADHHVVRLIYFHPPGIMGYHDIVTTWMQQTGSLRDAGRFRWYTMSGLAGFLNSRKQVQWETSRDGEQFRITATHPQSLEHATWWLPANRFSEPAILRGSAQVVRENEAWMVIAGPGNELQFESKMVK